MSLSPESSNSRRISRGVVRMSLGIVKIQIKQCIRLLKNTLFIYKLPVLPPSTGTLIPLMYEAAGEARNAAAAATS